VYKEIKKVQTPDFFIKYAENSITELNQQIIKFFAQEASEVLSQPQLVEKKISELETMVNNKYPWSLDTAMSLYDYKAIQESHGDLLRTLIAFMIIFNYHSKLEPSVKEIFSSIDEATMRQKFPEQYQLYY
jgi:hypothetical protein